MSSSNSDHSALLEVGRIGKPHGLRGEVVVSFSTNLIEARTTPGSVLDAEGTVLTVRSARPHTGKWLIVFEGVSSREDAERLRGRILRAEPAEFDSPTGPITPEAEHGAEVVALVHELIGARLIDQHGTDHGPVRSVIDNPASDLLELADGRLVPLTFYRSHDASAGTVVVEVPIGLLDDGAETAGGPGESKR